MKELVELYMLAEIDNIVVDSFRLNNSEALSIMDEDGSCFIAIDPIKLTGCSDEKIKLAHELGHCKTGSFYNQYSSQDIRNKHENRADKWAITTLITKEELEEAVRQGNTEVWSLAEYFDVPEDFMRMVICWYIHGTLATELYFPA